jgi:LacI family transcriptional regulator
VGVPQEIAVTGFDDIPIAQYTSPPLTSVRVPIIELGERATERLVQTLSSDRRRRRECETLATTLVVRQSCGFKTGSAAHHGTASPTAAGGRSLFLQTLGRSAS